MSGVSKVCLWLCCSKNIKHESKKKRHDNVNMNIAFMIIELVFPTGLLLNCFISLIVLQLRIVLKWKLLCFQFSWNTQWSIMYSPLRAYGVYYCIYWLTYIACVFVHITGIHTNAVSMGYFSCSKTSWIYLCRGLIKINFEANVPLGSIRTVKT